MLWRDPSGIDILLAPPRVEMAEMVTPRDVDKILSLLRRVYQADRHRHVVGASTTSTSRSSTPSDTIIEIVTYDSTTIHNTIAMADTFRIDRLPGLEGAATSSIAPTRPGGIDPDDLQRALGRVPEHRVVSDGQLVVQSNNEGVPFVLANPSAPISQDVARVAASSSWRPAARVPAAARPRIGGRCPTPDRSASSTPGSAA